MNLNSLALLTENGVLYTNLAYNTPFSIDS